jgi:beta-glucosidase
VAAIQAALRANSRCIVVLVGGSTYTMEEWRHQVPSILMAWYPGMEGGHALARVLFGDVNPSGRMPLTTPRSETQLPPFDEFADTAAYGPYHGYTLADRSDQEPAFPFGYGLSYTTYAYANLTVRRPRVPADGTVEVNVDVTNTGARAGEEVVQLYVGFEGSKVERPVRLLRGFRKVALAPGETKTVALPVAVKDLAWYDVGAKAWRVEAMSYGIFVGPSSRRADLLEARVTVTEDR